VSDGGHGFEGPVGCFLPSGGLSEAARGLTNAVVSPKQHAPSARGLPMNPPLPGIGASDAAMLRSSAGLRPALSPADSASCFATFVPSARVIGLLGSLLAMLVSISACSGAGGGSVDTRPMRPTEPYLAPYVVTSQEVVEEMLRLAGVGKDDLVYDLGSGDGRIVITAARLYGARGVGVELDPELVRRARDNARRANVSHLVEFRQQDLMTVDLSLATVVTLYLGREANLKLRPRLRAQLRPGARVVSHEFDMGDWGPSAILRVRDESSGFRTLYLWRIESGRPGG